MRRLVGVVAALLWLSPPGMTAGCARPQDGGAAPREEREKKREAPMEPTGADRMALARLRSPPLGLPPVSVPEDNPATIEKVALGRKLFFDRRLSVNNTMSCAMCHVPEQGFTNNELATPVGVNGRSLRRNAPTILNVAHAQRVFLDGREPSLEAQAVKPLLARDEMANPSAEALIERVLSLRDYDKLFEQAFGEGPSMERIAQAIATWERTLLAGDAPFDRWRYGGEAGALSEEQRRGFDLFTGKGNCSSCHSLGEQHALFTDHGFHDTGVGYRHDRLSPQDDATIPVEIAPGLHVPVDRAIIAKVEEPRLPDEGRFEVTRDPADRWHFRTPGLRNVALTAPYMHDGHLPSLESVVRFYDRGGVPHAGLDPLIRPLGLDDREVAALAAFLESLTSHDIAALQADARSVAVGN